MVIAYAHSKGGLRPFTVKKGKNLLFLINFVIKTAGTMNIPPGISVSICDNGTLKAEIETPELTE